MISCKVHLLLFYDDWEKHDSLSIPSLLPSSAPQYTTSTEPFIQPTAIIEISGKELRHLNVDLDICTPYTSILC